MYTYFSSSQASPILRKWPFKIFTPFIDKLFAIDWFNRELNEAMKKHNYDIKSTWSNFAEHLNIKLAFDQKHSIPHAGPLQVIATHGGELLDIIILGAIIIPTRSNLKFIALSELENISFFPEFCFFSPKNSSSTQHYQLLSNHLSDGNVLCHFSLSWEAATKNQAKKIKYHKSLSPLPYTLHKRSFAPILPINLKFKKPWAGNLSLYFQEKLLYFKLRKLAHALSVIDGIFSFRTLRAMQGKTVTIMMGSLITESPAKLTRTEATKWVAQLLGLEVLGS